MQRSTAQAFSPDLFSLCAGARHATRETLREFVIDLDRIEQHHT